MTSPRGVGLGEGWTKGAFCARGLRAAALEWLPKPILHVSPLAQWAPHKDQRAWGLGWGEIIPRSQEV